VTTCSWEFSDTTNEEGEFWLMIATDAGFEGITTWYDISIPVVIDSMMPGRQNEVVIFHSVPAHPGMTMYNCK